MPKQILLTDPITVESIPSELQSAINDWNAICPKSCRLPLADFNEYSKTAWQRTIRPLLVYPEKPFDTADLRSSAHNQLLGEVGPFEYASNIELATSYEHISLSYYYDNELCNHLKHTTSISEDDIEMKRLKRERDNLFSRMNELRTEIAERKDSLTTRVEGIIIVLILCALLYVVLFWPKKKTL